jgi:hypothetical protein
MLSVTMYASQQAKKLDFILVTVIADIKKIGFLHNFCVKMTPRENVGNYISQIY